MRYMGTDDSVNICDHCGKSNLKRTVCLELDSGELVHYGVNCAGVALNAGKTFRDPESIKGFIEAREKAKEKKARAIAEADRRAIAANRVYVVLRRVSGGVVEYSVYDLDTVTRRNSAAMGSIVYETK